VVRGPRLADEVIEGPAIVGGLVAGEMKLPDGTRFVVLQGGFIVKATADRIYGSDGKSPPSPTQTPPRTAPRTAPRAPATSPGGASSGYPQR